MEMLRHIAKLHADPLDTDALGERLGLGDCGRTPYRRLSGGQQQRLGLAMALVGRPEVVFVDEPTSGIDPQVRRTTWELLEELRADGVTVVLTTHHMDEAERLADRVHIIDKGRLVASGSPLELMRGGSVSTIRLLVTEPFPPGASESLKAALGPHRGQSARRAQPPGHRPRRRVHPLQVSRWCDDPKCCRSRSRSASATSRTSSSSSPAGAGRDHGTSHRCREPLR